MLDSRCRDAEMPRCHGWFESSVASYDACLHGQGIKGIGLITIQEVTVTAA